MLKPHQVDDCPFVDLPQPKSSRWGGGVTAEEMREMQWVRPELVAQMRFVEWTAEGRLRHAAFLGLRSDKSARRGAAGSARGRFVTVSVGPERTEAPIRILVLENTTRTPRRPSAWARPAGSSTCPRRV